MSSDTTIAKARTEGKRDGLARAQRVTGRMMQLWESFARGTNTKSQFVLGARFALMSIWHELRAAQNKPERRAAKVGNA